MRRRHIEQHRLTPARVLLKARKASRAAPARAAGSVFAARSLIIPNSNDTLNPRGRLAISHWESVNRVSNACTSACISTTCKRRDCLPARCYPALAMLAPVPRGRGTRLRFFGLILRRCNDTLDGEMRPKRLDLGGA